MRYPETDRLFFRPLAYDDEAALYEMFADAYARKFYPQMDQREKVRRWIDWNLENYQRFQFGLWALILKKTGALIGDCGLTYQDVEGREELEVGYHLIEAARGKGYATEAAAACLYFGFRNTGCELICSTVRPDNLASRAVAGRVHHQMRQFQRTDQTLLLFWTTREQWAKT